MENTGADSASSEQHLFTESDTVHYEAASTGQRFGNYLIDNLLMQFGLSFAVGFLLAQFLMAVSPETAYDWFGEGEGRWGVSYLIGLLDYLLYYTVCEKLFRGYTLGKLITGTRAVRNDGGELTLKDAFLRSLSRMVPFEALSLWIGGGLWHDRWTNTTVIKTRR